MYGIMRQKKISRDYMNLTNTTMKFLCLFRFEEF